MFVHSCLDLMYASVSLSVYIQANVVLLMEKAVYFICIVTAPVKCELKNTKNVTLLLSTFK